MKISLDLSLFMDIIEIYVNNLRIIIIMNLSELHLHFGTSQYKGKKYRSYSLAKPYRANGKNRKDIIFPLGKLTDEEANKWRYLLKALKKPDVFLTSFDNTIKASLLPKKNLNIQTKLCSMCASNGFSHP